MPSFAHQAGRATAARSWSPPKGISRSDDAGATWAASIRLPAARNVEELAFAPLPKTGQAPIVLIGAVPGSGIVTRRLQITRGRATIRRRCVPER